MASDEERERHSRRRKKNIYAKILFDPNEYKGAFSMKVVDPKNRYKREKLSINSVYDEGEDKEVEIMEEDE